jgi:uncharacterized protein with HEPN domain
MKRSSSYSPENLLEHIQKEIEILLEIQRRVSKKQFFKDEFLKRTAERCFEKIGEATKKLSDEVKNLTSEIEWKRIAGMRDVVIHDYLDVDYEILWNIMSEKIPDLKKSIKKLKKKLSDV